MANKAGQYEYKFEFTTKGTYGFNDKDSIKSTEVKTFELSAVDDEPAETIELETPEEQSGEINLNWNVVEKIMFNYIESVRDGVIVKRIQMVLLFQHKRYRCKINKSKL